MRPNNIKISRLAILFIPIMFWSCGTKNNIPKSTEYQYTSNNKSTLNVLFIAVDDLRPLLGSYGVKYAKTPQIDHLASQGRIFKKHYVQVATCGASRASMLTGQLPRTKNQLKNKEALESLPRNYMDIARTMPELFRKNGYETICIGKISHSDDGWINKNSTKDSTNYDLPNAWDKVMTPLGNWKKSLVVAYQNGKDRDDGSGYMPYSLFPKIEDNELPDGMFADTAIEQLKTFGKSGKPFFMGLGFLKPHLPFVSPKKYRDMYNDVKIPSTYGMQRGDTKKTNKSAEFYKYRTDRPFKRPVDPKTLSEQDAQNIRRAYMACVTYTDTQIGKVLKTLEDVGLSNNTIVVLWGDHGWHLGENNVWGKHTPLDKGLHSPLIIKTPHQQKPGESTTALAASIDIFPTLIEACQLKNRDTYKPLDGVSLIPAIKNPDFKVRNEVISFWRGPTTIVNEQYRLIVSGQLGKLNHELYDHITDPEELKNIADKNPKTIEKMMHALKEAYPTVLIKNNFRK